MALHDSVWCKPHQRMKHTAATSKVGHAHSPLRSHACGAVWMDVLMEVKLHTLTGKSVNSSSIRKGYTKLCFVYVTRLSWDCWVYSSPPSTVGNTEKP